MAQQQIRNAGIACGRKVISILAGISGAGFALGWVCEHLTEIGTALNAAWIKCLFAISLGGSFWASITIGLTMLVTIGWACCVDNHLSKANRDGDAPYSWPLIRIGLVASVIWLLSFCAMNQTINSINDLTAYGAIAVVIMCLPFVLLGGLVIACVCMIMGAPSS